MPTSEHTANREIFVVKIFPWLGSTTKLKHTNIFITCVCRVVSCMLEELKSWMQLKYCLSGVAFTEPVTVLLCCQEHLADHQRLSVLVNKWAGFINSFCWLLHSCVHMNTSIITAVSSNSHTVLSRSCALHVCVRQVNPRKYFNTILLHENFPIYVSIV